MFKQIHPQLVSKGIRWVLGLLLAPRIHLDAHGGAATTHRLPGYKAFGLTQPQHALASLPFNATAAALNEIPERRWPWMILGLGPMDRWDWAPMKNIEQYLENEFPQWDLMKSNGY